ncbi:DUF885 family protein [Croceicoccus sp. YJ47]|uniref:DUF885 domain-containing protein n=1 Tax=Croceicoccus sp. YJ47 TaxID=2798724 RepID=UPI00192177F4|nr:DUF885 domain-containing protein [Croceicoccus sp. YJ47]QQN74677.1 DUF885 domain-containing protein [Croceicoccus sp. YJ47]
MKALIPMLLASASLAGCATVETPEVPTYPMAENEQGAALNAEFEAFDEAQLALSPESRTYRGIRDDSYGEWSPGTDAAEIADERLLQQTAQRIAASYDPANLNEEDALSYELFAIQARNSAALFPYRDYGYIFDQMNGAQSSFPAFLINQHVVENEDHALAYISRIEGIGPVMDTLIARSAARAQDGIMPPRWVYPYVISDIDNLLETGSDYGDQAIIEDFREKVAALDLSSTREAELNAAAIAAWRDSAAPSYRRLRTEMERQMAMASTDDGVWRFPQGDEYYAARLKDYTTTDLTAEQIHNIGLREIDRIHDEMRAIMTEVGFEGDLQEFFEYTRTDPRFYYDTREAYLADVSQKLDRMEAALPQYFGMLPTDPLVVKPVEAFREQSAGKAFYSSPAPDGSRPGTYYVNLYRLEDMSKNELEALAYHEGLPGHHLQLSIQTGLDDLPAFRRFGRFTAYTEGWGLYSEELGKDMGFYQDPYSDFGRLGMELWRAARLVVDTGIHSKRWSREEAIAYLSENTPNPDGDIEKAIERYIVYPGQATAYMIGKLKIMEVRDRAQAALGDRFDWRGFHDTILASGPVPLSVMEENVDAWIAAQQGA